MQAACQRRQAHPGLGKREDGPFRGYDDVAGQRDLEAAAHGDAIHSRDQGLFEVKAVGEAREARFRPAHLAARGLVFEVVASREGPVACPGHDGDPLLRIVLKIVENGRKLLAGRSMDGVHHLGPVEGDEGQCPIPFDLAEFVSHERPLCCLR